LHLKYSVLHFFFTKDIEDWFGCGTLTYILHLCLWFSYYEEIWKSVSFLTCRSVLTVLCSMVLCTRYYIRE